jgi:uncharacterized protein with HEPN domain
MNLSFETRLHDVTTTIDQARAMIAGMDFREFSDDRLRRLAAERAIEIVVDALRDVPEPLKATAPHLKWERMFEVREFLWDHYYAVDARMVWDFVQDHFPMIREFSEHLARDRTVEH